MHFALLCLILHLWQLNQLFDARSPLLFTFKTEHINLNELLRVHPFLDFRDILLTYFLFDLLFRTTFESHIFSYHLIQNAAEGPDISFLVVRISLQKLRAAVAQGSKLFKSPLVKTLIVLCGYSEVCEFGVVIFTMQKDVLWLQVSVNYAFIVNVIE